MYTRSAGSRHVVGCGCRSGIAEVPATLQGLASIVLGNQAGRQQSGMQTGQAISWRRCDGTDGRTDGQTARQCSGEFLLGTDSDNDFDFHVQYGCRCCYSKVVVVVVLVVAAVVGGTHSLLLTAKLKIFIKLILNFTSRCCYFYLFVIIVVVAVVD